MNLDTPIEKIPRIGAFYQKRLKKLGIKTVYDLFFHFPHRYEDFSKIIPIAEVKLNEVCCIQGKILEIKNSRTWKKRMILTQAIVEDKSSAIKVIWFNQPYLIKSLKTGDMVCLAGKIALGRPTKGGYPELYLSSPAHEKIPITNNQYPISNLTHTGRLIPVYPETEGLSSRWLRYILKLLLLKFKDRIPEILPKEILRENKLLPISKAIWQIHFPDSKKSAQIAKNRFSFEELFLIQLSVLKERLKLNSQIAISIPLNIDLIKEFVNSLPFRLTNAQRKCAWQILKDLEKPRPMNRLLQGDVGSGKTIVAMLSALNVAKAGYQTAFMAPTEILAQQHFKTIAKFLSPFKLKIALLTGKEDKVTARKLKDEILEISRKKLLEKTRKGEVDILIGTHALIQDKVKFGSLGLVIVDEQHRFGVEQRARLCQNSGEKIKLIPHFLSMTATPIPRTLALTVYGDLDLSLIDEMPKGRKKIETKIVSPEKRKIAYDFIRNQVKKDKRVFVICPRIEPVPTLPLLEGVGLGGQASPKKDIWGWAEVKAVKEEYEKLSKDIFPDLKIGMLHGKMKTNEKEKIMRDFKEGGIDILVSTSVVEVGIDIPKATVMMIEGTERFGLAQLHQFRGRVGRSDSQSYCFLFTDSKASKTSKRLSALLRYEDGFALAEKDLEIRGPGSLYGIQQWGIPDFAMENLKNISLVEKTRELAKELLEKNPELTKYPLLRNRLRKFRERIHLE